MLQQIRARMSKIKIEQRENNKGKYFFWGVKFNLLEHVQIITLEKFKCP